MGWRSLSSHPRVGYEPSDSLFTSPPELGLRFVATNFPHAVFEPERGVRARRSKTGART
jgi:hypothetical protein